MKGIEQEINNLTSQFTSLNDDYLTENELQRAYKFIDILNGSLRIPDSRKRNECNGLKQYIESLVVKINKRILIPNWYSTNKLN